MFNKKDNYNVLRNSMKSYLQNKEMDQDRWEYIHSFLGGAGKVDSNDEKMTEKEVKEAIKELTVKRALGPDNIASIFYKYFSSFNWYYIVLYNFKSLTESLNLGNISFIKERDEGILMVNNYLPITLLNGDYMILVIIMAKHIIHHIDNKINIRQSARVPGHSIQQNLVTLKLIQEIYKCKKVPLFMVTLGIHNAFNSVIMDLLMKI
ncbi:uncharacterized protein LOC111631893 [Centruroides sculpturatus]|uniref:uncharacterized protein LOC111631893 n=1 Tax=Centruroides sculpturatus TaxID=218467 RepID=UPI000C6D8BA1|nr:uncharacterized protein LOC111631893 [Centruroides sculpturatus]